MAFYSNALDFPNLTSKGTPTTSDLIMIADAAASNVPKQATVGSLPFPTVPVSVTNGGTGVATLTTAYGVLTAGTTATGNVQTLAALGASGTVLTSNGASALPSFQAVAAGASGLTWIATVTASAQATVDFNNNLTSTYDNYIVVFENVVSAAGSGKLQILAGTGAGPTYQTSAYAGVYVGYLSGAISGVTSGTAAVDMTPAQVLSTTTSGAAGFITIHNVNNASNFKAFTAHTFVTSLFGCVSVGTWGGATVLSSLRFKFASGNLTSGTFKLYGYQN
jgi:hypothetical protein